jgi:hypothetical protein
MEADFDIFLNTRDMLKRGSVLVVAAAVLPN